MNGENDTKNVNENNNNAASSPDPSRVYITNLPFSCSWQDVKDLLRNKLGKVGRVELLIDHQSGRSKGSAVVDFTRVLKENPTDDAPFMEPSQAQDLASRAICELNGLSFRGRTLTVRVDRVGTRNRRTRQQQQAQEEHDAPAAMNEQTSKPTEEELGTSVSTEPETEDNSFQTISKTRRGRHRLTADGQKRIASGKAKSTYTGKLPSGNASKPRMLQRYQADAFDDSVKPRQATEPEYRRSQIDTSNVNVNLYNNANGSNHENMIHIGNLPFRTTWQDLKDLLAQYGHVIRCDVAADRLTGKPKGFATARFATKVEADKVIEAINGMEFQGRELKLKPYVWREYK